MAEHSLEMGKAVLWTAIYFGFMLFYTLLDVAMWRKYFPKISGWLNVLTASACGCGFFLLACRAGYPIQIFSSITFMGILLALGCSILFFLLLDQCLDPVFERLFPQSQQGYEKTLQSLREFPVPSLLQVCVLAPVMEEFLMRGLVLGGLQSAYGIWPALLVSSLLFALLHFNMVQTLSAFVCGLVLGLLYLHTGSLFCCMLAHCGYNLISYLTMIISLPKK